MTAPPLIHTRARSRRRSASSRSLRPLEPATPTSTGAAAGPRRPSTRRTPTGPASSELPAARVDRAALRAGRSADPSGTAALSAQADASTRAMHALAYVATDDRRTCRTTAPSTRGSATRSPCCPAAGLSAGDAVRLVLKPGFHAQFSQGPSGTGQPPSPSLTIGRRLRLARPQADSAGRLRAPGGRAGLLPGPRRVLLGERAADGRRAAATPSDPDGSLTLDSRWSWELHSNTSPDDGDSAEGLAEICHAWPECHIAVTDPEFAPLKPLDSRPVSVRSRSR